MSWKASGAEVGTAAYWKGCMGMDMMVAGYGKGTLRGNEEPSDSGEKVDEDEQIAESVSV